jgi:multidrug resistance efflux pump
LTLNAEISTVAFKVILEPAIPVGESSDSSRAAERFSIFEQVALERLQGGSDSTKAASFLPLPVRLTAIAAIAIAGLGVLWSIVARVPVQVNGTAAIVPTTGLGRLTSPTNGFLRYQVSGVGPDQLSAAQKQRNALISEFWSAEYLSVLDNMISKEQLRQVARAALVQDPGQPLIVPQDLPGHPFVDQPGKNILVSYPAGTLLAHIVDPLAYEQLNASRQTKVPMAALQAEQQRERMQRAGNLKNLTVLQRNQRQTLEQELADRQSLYARYQKLWEKGYLPGTKLLDEKSRINGIENQLLANDSTQLTTESSQQDEIQQSKQAGLSNIDARSKLEGEVTRFLKNTNLFAPAGGFYLLDANFKNGSLIQEGDEILSYTTSPPALPAVLPVFLEATSAQQVQQGMRVLLTPKGISRAEYGGIPGKVVTVNQLPVLGDGLLGTVGSSALVNAIQQLLPSPYLVRVQLEQAEPRYCSQALSRRCYRWSSGRLPPHPVRLATLADVQITTDYRRPIEFVMPAIKRALGLVVDN